MDRGQQICRDSFLQAAEFNQAMVDVHARVGQVREDQEEAVQRIVNLETAVSGPVQQAVAEVQLRPNNAHGQFIEGAFQDLGEGASTTIFVKMLTRKVHEVNYNGSEVWGDIVGQYNFRGQFQFKDVLLVLDTRLSSVGVVRESVIVQISAERALPEAPLLQTKLSCVSF